MIRSPLENVATKQYSKESAPDFELYTRSVSFTQHATQSKVNFTQGLFLSHNMPYRFDTQKLVKGISGGSG